MSLKTAIKRTPLAIPYIFAKGLVRKPATQNDEAEILARIVSEISPPRSFVEFGFGGWEFNCAPLAYEWEGLLLDGDRYNVTIARTILPRRVKALHQWITLDTLQPIRDWCQGRQLGILSVDVDGNDYWFLKALIHLKPAIIIAEYNSTFGLRPITIPYDPAFDYRSAHPTWTYGGASLAALNHLVSSHGYSLVAGGEGGINAFFARTDLLTPTLPALTEEQVYRPGPSPFSDGSTPEERWDRIKDMPFVDVTAAL